MNSLHWIARAAIGGAGVGGLGLTVWGVSKTATAQAPTSTPNSRYPLDIRVGEAVATTALSPEQRKRWLPPAQEAAYQAFMASGIQIKGDDAFQQEIRGYVRELCTREIGRELLHRVQQANPKLMIEHAEECAHRKGIVEMAPKDVARVLTIDFRRPFSYYVTHPPWF